MNPELKAALDALGMSQSQAIEAQQKAHKEFTDTVSADTKKRDAAWDAKIEKLNAELDKFEPMSAALVKAEAEAKASVEAKAATDKAFQEQLDRIETLAKKPPGLSDEDTEKQKAKASGVVFWDFVRKGTGTMAADRLNVLTISDDTTGGYLAPPEYVADIIKGVVEFSPMRSLVTVRSTSSKSVQIPKRTSVLTAEWIGEIELRGETPGPTWGLEEIPVNELTATSYVSNWNLEDSMFNLETVLREEYVEQFGVAEAIAIITGNGVKKPQGILNAVGTVASNSGAATAVTSDGLIDLKYSLKSVYARNGTFVLNRGSLKAIRKLKDGIGNYMWVPGLAVGRPNAIDGDPYVEAPDMPDIAAGAKAIAFGDLRRAYILVDRMSMSVMRDPYTRANVGQVRFVARRRVGGQVVLGEALAIQTIQV